MTCRVVVLPRHVVEDILSRLPVKSFHRLRCLSKSWDSLISTDQSFASMHLKRASQQFPKLITSSGITGLSSSPCPLLSLDHENYSSFADEGAISTLDFPSKGSFRNKDRTLVVGSCHGLICLAVRRENDLYLWNPSTRDYHNLPDPYPCLLPNKPPQIKYLLDYCAFGFGYDSYSDDYKVFLGLRAMPLPYESPRTPTEEKVAVFSTRENCWRIIQQFPSNMFYQYPWRGSFVNGTLNWLAPKLVGEKFSIYTLVAFDLKTEKFFKFPMPNKDARYVRADLGVLDTRLCLSVVNNDDHDYFPPSYLVELWVMNEYGVGQSWTRLLNAPFQSQRVQHLPLCRSKDNQIILSSGRYSLTRIDAEGRKLEKCNICNCEKSHHCSSCQAIAHVESIVWPFVRSTCVEKQKRHGRLRKRKECA